MTQNSQPTRVDGVWIMESPPYVYQAERRARWFLGWLRPPKWVVTKHLASDAGSLGRVRSFDSEHEALEFLSRL